LEIQQHEVVESSRHANVTKAFNGCEQGNTLCTGSRNLSYLSHMLRMVFQAVDERCYGQLSDKNAMYSSEDWVTEQTQVFFKKITGTGKKAVNQYSTSVAKGVGLSLKNDR
jgi:hypothetical protein